MKITSIKLALVLLLILHQNILSQNSIIEFNSDNWNLVNAEISEHLGRQALQGTAVLKDVEFTNGIIEVDLCLSGERSYPGINFRMQSQQEYEHFYRHWPAK